MLSIHVYYAKTTCGVLCLNTVRDIIQVNFVNSRRLWLAELLSTTLLAQAQTQQVCYLDGTEVLDEGFW